MVNDEIFKMAFTVFKKVNTFSDLSFALQQTKNFIHSGLIEETGKLITFAKEHSQDDPRKNLTELLEKYPNVYSGLKQSFDKLYEQGLIDYTKFDQVSELCFNNLKGKELLELEEVKKRIRLVSELERLKSHLLNKIKNGTQNRSKEYDTVILEVKQSIESYLRTQTQKKPKKGFFKRFSSK